MWDTIADVAAEGFLGPVLGPFARGVGLGQEGAEERVQAEREAMERAQPMFQRTGLADLYEGARELPHVGPALKLAPHLRRGALRAGGTVRELIDG